MIESIAHGLLVVVYMIFSVLQAMPWWMWLLVIAMPIAVKVDERRIQIRMAERDRIDDIERRLKRLEDRSRS